MSVESTQQSFQCLFGQPSHATAKAQSHRGFLTIDSPTAAALCHPTNSTGAPGPRFNWNHDLAKKNSPFRRHDLPNIPAYREG